MKIRLAAIAFALAAAFSAPAGAATVGFQVDRSLGGPQIYTLSDGTFLGLWRFNTRDRVDNFDKDVTINSAADLRERFTDRTESSVLGFYNGPRGLTGPEFTPLDFGSLGLTLVDGEIFRRSVWVNFSAGRIVYVQPNGNRARMNSKASSGVRTDITLVPTPAALPLLLAGLGAFGLMARRRMAG